MLADADPAPRDLPPMTTVEDAFVAYRTTRDPAALAAVYDGTSSRMLAVALHLSGSASAAEDAVQDTFLFALENPERWDATRPLMPWLLGILSNILKQSAYRARRTPDPERLQLPETSDPESAMAANELLSSIDQAITDLPQPYRTVVLLRLRNGLSPADIAVALDRKPSTVRAQLTRGVEMLRKVLPTGVAGVLIGSVALSRGLTAAREVVMNRAAELHRAVLAQQSAAALRLWSLRVVAMLCVALAAWGVSGLIGEEPPVPVVVPENPEVASVPVATEQAELLQLTGGVSLTREEVALVGALDVTVRRAGVAMPRAVVTLEPLPNPPRAVVHRTSSSRGSWEHIESLRPAAPNRHKRSMTAGDGRCSFEDLTAGFWICRSLGKEAVVRIDPGKKAALELAVEPGSRLVRGLVLTANGRPVAGADVWTCREHLLRVRKVVARTDASGRFELAVAPYTTIGTVHDGYAPIGITVGRKATLPPLDLLLQFDEAGAELTGVVRDERGEPVAGAEVEVGHASDTRVSPEVGSIAAVARPVRVRTDTDGTFRIASLVPGQTTVIARGKGLAASGQLVELQPGKPQSVALQLARGGSIVGLVQDTTGEPMAGVAVRIGRPGSMSYRSASTGEDGRYRLHGVAAGQALVEFNDYRGGFASHLQNCEAGSVATLDAVLSGRDLHLIGEVVGEGGVPLAHGWIQHRHLSGRRAYQLDAEGRFAIRVSERSAAIPGSLLVFAADPRRIEPKDLPAPLAAMGGVRPGPQRLRVEIGPQQRHASWLRGTIRLGDGSVSRDSVLVRRIGEVGWRRYRSSVAADGTFQVGPMPEGRYLVRVDGQSGAFGPFAVAGSMLDVGALVIDEELMKNRPAFNRQIALVYPAGVPLAQWAFVEVRDHKGRVVVAKTHPGSLSDLSELYVRLPEGQFTLRVTTKQGYGGSCDVVVDANIQPRRAVVVALSRS